MDLIVKHKVGTCHRNFTVTQALPIKELQCILYQLQHEPTGAQVMHVACDDPENLFCLSFQTLPTNSTGAAHILEHTVLCGSEKFPVKDPFFSMNRRSLNTFMNAMTGADFTCYPAASQVEKDFYNLLEVYLDALFFPELKTFSFLQEGHRLEFEKPDDPTSPLLFKGIVFNEMKGGLSNPESRLWHQIMEGLTPDLPYAFNSGGDPKQIPDLTYEGLKAFHEKFYHPGHCLFFFYGSFPLTKHLDFIEKNVLKGSEKASPLPLISPQKRFKGPKIHEGSYPLQEKDLKKKTYTVFGWLTTPVKNQREVLALSVLDSILMETDASPLKLALLKSGLCTQTDGYLDLDASELPYVIICRGSEKKDREKLKELIFKTLREIATEGIAQNIIEAAIHQLEFSRLEITHDYGPFGLTLFMRSGLLKQHGCLPENGLTIYSQFNALAVAAKDPRFFPSLIEKYFLNNPHLIELTMSPDSHLEEKERRDEQEKLKKIQEGLTQDERIKLINQAQALEAFQKKTEKQSIDSLPKIELSDVPKETPDFLLHHEQKDHLTIFHHDTFTNHILYADLIFDLPKIEERDLPYVPLLISLLPEIGAGSRDYKENLAYINAYLGGFSATLHLHPQAKNPSLLKPSFGLRGKVLSQHTDKLFTLFKEVCRSPLLDDKDRIKELIFQIHTSLQTHLNQNAMSYATQLTLSQLTPSAHMGRYWSGINYFTFIHNLAQNLIQDQSTHLPQLIDTLKRLQNQLSHLNTPHLVVTCDQDQYHTLSKEAFYDLSDLPSKPFSPWENSPLPPATLSQCRPISSPVAFSVLGFKGSEALAPSAPALSISTHLLENTFFHARIREQGGAYGSGANYNSVTGHYYLYAYRDPHIAKTYEVFREGIAQIAAGAFTEQDIEEAKLGLIREYDTPVSPGSRGITSYSYFREGKTKQIRQDYRDHLLDIEKEEVIKVVTDTLLSQKDQGVAVTLASEELIKKEVPDRKIIPI